MIKRIIFVRHGETVDNAAGRAQGWSDSALTERGKRQVLRLADRLCSAGLTHLVSSPLGRALSTAEAISSATNIPFEQMDEFREMNCGRWEGMSFELVRQSDPEFHRQWVNDPHVACPDGESFADIRERLRVGLASLQQRINGHEDAVVAIVSHGTAIRIAATEMLDLPLTAARQFAQDNTALNIFDWRADRFVLRLWNDASHCNGHD